jgi:hypothetical protein
MTDQEADKLFDSILSKVEKRLARRMLTNFNNLSSIIRNMVQNLGNLEDELAILENQRELEQILIESYEESIREGVRFTRRDLNLSKEEDEDNFNEALLLLLLWRQDTARTHAQQITRTTINIYRQLDDEARVRQLTDESRQRFIAREMAKRNRSRISVIATSEAGEAVSAGSQAQATLVNKQLLKSWRSQRDSRVRSSHVRADQRYNEFPIPNDLPFQVGSGSGQYPRDSSLPKKERAGCRCYLRHRFAEFVPELDT